jgi:tetratricopeptide (TPR) repeat protein
MNRLTVRGALLLVATLSITCSELPRATSDTASGHEPVVPGLRVVESDADTEAWAWDLVAPADGRTGQRDAIVARWLSRVAGHPDHPLAEATLRLAGAVRSDLEDPPASRAALLALGTPRGLTPAARISLDRLQGYARIADEPTDPRAPDAFPAVLRTFEVLGPLDPTQDPSAKDMDPEFIANPGFGDTHAGVRGDIRWMPLDRSAYSAGVDPRTVLESSAGWCVLAARFDVPRGGPAWLEINLGSGAGSSFDGSAGAVFSYGATSFSRVSPTAGYAWSMNGGASTTVDYLEAERSAVTRVPVVLRDGSNLLLVRLRATRSGGLSVSIHDTDGGPYPDLVGSRSGSGLGAPVADERAPPALRDSESFLLSMPEGERGPGAEALLGLLQLLDRRPAMGLGRMEAALTRSQGSPEAVDLAAQLSGVIAQVSYLPESWRRARSRELAEQVLAEDPDNLPMGIALAKILAREDREEDALVELDRLSTAYPHQSRSLVEAARLFGRLGLEARQEALLASAVELAPRSPLALGELAQRMTRYSAEQLSAPLRERRRAAAGITAQRLEQFAYELSRGGRTDEAGELWKASLIRAPDRSRRLRHADYLFEIGEVDEAELVSRQLAEEFPRWERPWRLLADVALRRGDRDAELAALREVNALDPSDRPTRDRLNDMGVPDPVEALRDRFLMTSEEALGRYTETVRDDSVVRVLDQAAIKLFADGSAETITHEIVQVRDLDACNTEGELRLDGEVLRIATLKRETGEVFEPVRVSGSYVMPQLEPGDFVERITRARTSPPSLVVRPGRWFFRSVSEPFVVSRYVVSVPRSLDVRLVTHGEVDLYETYEVGDDIVHVFESLEEPRVLVERGAPPGPWFLPWVEFGMDDDTDSMAAVYRAQLLPFVEVTPEIERAADGMLRETSGQHEAARALYGFVNETLVQRSAGPVPAVQALLSRSGNPVLLYAALLEAAGIEHDLVWSRGVAPAADPEPDPPFVDIRRVQNQLLVVVRPDDAPQAWCAMSSRTLPYGELMGNAPGAPAITVRGGEWIAMPMGSEADRPGVRVGLDIDLALDGSGEVSGELAYLGGWGFAAKQQIREAPEIHHRSIVESIAAGVLPGLELEDYSIVGLHDDERLAFRFNGHAPRFLDAEGGRPLPIRRLEMSRSLAIEGERTLPFLQEAVNVDDASIVLRLPEGMELIDPPPGLRDSYEGQTYELSITRGDGNEWILQRDFDEEPFSIGPDEYPELLGFARRIDEAESAWLRFSRPGPSGR